MASTTVFLIEYLQGFGFPKCTRREHCTRLYDNPAAAAIKVKEIRGMPSHHQLISVKQSAVEWVEYPDAWLPTPEVDYPLAADDEVEVLTW